MALTQFNLIEVLINDDIPEILFRGKAPWDESRGVTVPGCQLLGWMLCNATHRDAPSLQRKLGGLIPVDKNDNRTACRCSNLNRRIEVINRRR